MSPLTFSAEQAQRVEGIVQQVDPLNRELLLVIDGELKSFTVPPECPIYLTGEMVGLRLLQPNDRVHLTFTRQSGAPVASSIHASWFPNWDANF